MTDLRADRAVRRAWEAHRRGVQAGAAGRPVLGARHLRAGLLLLGWEDNRDQHVVQEAYRPVAARLLISLAHLQAEQGRTEYGLRLLDLAEEMTAPADRGILLSQRGLLLMRTWRIGEALRFFDAAVPLLDGYADVRVLARVLLNRGVLHLNVGSVQRARADFAWCQRVAALGRHDSLAAKAAHNLGCCDLLAGDIPAALKLFAAAEDGFRLTASPQWLPVLATDKARALLAVGLSSDAIAELDGAIAAFRRLRLDQDLAQAEMTLAQAALAAGALTSGAPLGGRGAQALPPPGQRRLRPPDGADPAPLAVRRAALPPRPHRGAGRTAGRQAARLPGCATTRTWPSCSRRARWSPPAVPPRRGDGSRPRGAGARSHRLRSACCASLPRPNWRSLSRGRPRC